MHSAQCTVHSAQCLPSYQVVSSLEWKQFYNNLVIRFATLLE